MIRLGHLRCLFGAVLVSTGGAAVEKSASPLAVLKALHTVQDSISHGDKEAFAMQSKIMELLHGTLENHLNSQGITPDWEESAIGYALAGAPSVRARLFLDQIGPSSRLHPVALASKAYVDGRLELAADLFEPIDIGGLPANLAPFAALAKATSHFDVTPYKSKAAYELALNLAPGTLVEEVSARRLSQLAIALDDSELFMRASFIYWRRHASSPFSREYSKEFSSGYIYFINDVYIKRLLNLVSTNEKHIYRIIIADVCSNLIEGGEFEKYNKLFNYYYNDFFHLDIFEDNLAIYEAIHKSSMDFAKKNIDNLESHLSKPNDGRSDRFIFLLINIIEQVNMSIMEENSLLYIYRPNSNSDDDVDNENKDGNAIFIDTNSIISVSSMVHSKFEKESEMYE